MKPPLTDESVDLYLQELITVRGMDPDDAMDWIEAYDTNSKKYEVK